MKKNSLMEECRKLITPEIQRSVDLSVDIADRIMDILAEKGMTQREFAKAMNKKESEISKWLQGTHNFTTATIAKIEMVLNKNILSITKSSLPKVDYVSTKPTALVLLKVVDSQKKYPDSFVYYDSKIKNKYSYEKYN